MYAGISFFLLLSACTSSPEDTGKPNQESDPVTPDSDSGGGGGGGDSDSPPVTECTEDAALLTGISVEVTDMPTVLRVTWSTAEPTDGAVVFWDSARAYTTALTGAETTEHEHLLVGMPASTEVSLKVVVGDKCSPVTTATTGTLPSGLPPLSATVNDADAVDGFSVVPVVTANTSFVSIIDSLGRYVWTKEISFVVYRARFSKDKTAVLYDISSSAIEIDGEIHRVSLAGEEEATYLIPGHHTDFVEADDGTIAALGWDIQEIEGRKFLGDILVEYAPDGTLTEVWNAFDHFEVDTSEQYPTGWYPGDLSVEDWSHANNLSYAEDDYFITLSTNNAIVRFDRDTMAQEWAMEDIFPTPDNPPEYFYNLHSAQYLGNDQLLVFNRGNYVDICSSAQEYTIDPDADTFVSTWSYTSEECYMVYYLGETRRLENGNTRIVWSTAGVIDEVDSAGNTLASYSLSLGAAFAFLDTVDTLY